MRPRGVQTGAPGGAQVAPGGLQFVPGDLALLAGVQLLQDRIPRGAELAKVDAGGDEHDALAALQAGAEGG